MATLCRRISPASSTDRPRVIVTADDFGRSSEINGAILKGHLHGILTSASLMVTGDAFEEAVSLAHQTPSLAVGLHVVVADGRSVLPQRVIPHLVDEQGDFRRSPLRAGLWYFWNREAQEELRLELQAQFQRFAETGLKLSHVDGHLHMHLHPTVLQILVPLASAHRAAGFRIPSDPLRAALVSRQRLLTKIYWAFCFGWLSRGARRKLRGRGVTVPARCYGLMQSGDMHEGYVVRLLEQLDDRLAELYFHPTTGQRLDPLGPNRGDLQSLTSAAVRQVVQQRRLRLSTYATATSAYEGCP